MVLYIHMTMTLYGISSLGFWLARSERYPRSLLSAADILATLAKPLHVSMRKSSRSGRSPHIEHAVSEAELSATERVGAGLRVPSPELCFIQVAASLPFHQAVKAGCALCSTFCLDPRSPFGLSERKPLTSVGKIEAFMDAHPGMRGAGKARIALRYVKERAASPAEIYQMMVLCLPAHRGGFGLSSLEPNCVIRLERRAAAIAQRSYLVPDLYDATHRVAVEYDADATHAFGMQLSKDAMKRLALESIGVKVITVTTRQLASMERMGDVAEETARAIGKRIRPRSVQHEPAQRLLVATRKSFDGLYDQAWLSQQRGVGEAAGEGSWVA